VTEKFNKILAEFNAKIHLQEITKWDIMDYYINISELEKNKGYEKIVSEGCDWTKQATENYRDLVKKIVVKFTT
jgi:hypothetical protein